MTEYEVSAAAAYVSGEYEAESPEDAIEQARQDVREALANDGFQLTDIEAAATDGTNDWAIDET